MCVLAVKVSRAAKLEKLVFLMDDDFAFQVVSFIVEREDSGSLGGPIFARGYPPRSINFQSISEAFAQLYGIETLDLGGRMTDEFAAKLSHIMIATKLTTVSPLSRRKACPEVLQSGTSGRRCLLIRFFRLGR